MAAVHQIKFLDLPEREKKARHFLETEEARLGKLLHPTQGEKDDLKRIKDVLAVSGTLVDPLFVAVRDSFNAKVGQLNHTLNGHSNGTLQLVAGSVVSGASPSASVLPAHLDSDVVRVAYVLGILATAGAPVPRVKRAPAGTTAPPLVVMDQNDDPEFALFTRAFFAALGEVQSSFDLAQLVLPILQLEGDRDGSGTNPGEVKTTEFAALMRCLTSNGVTVKDGELLQLRRKVNECLDSIQAVGFQKSAADSPIALPNLEKITAYPIQEKNVEAMGPMICAAMFDELKAFDVVDTILYQWQQGTLPIDVGEPGKMLYRYWKDAPNRMSEAERRGLYSMTMGIPGGSVNGNAPVNRDFNDLWMRFVSSVSALVRQKTVDQLLRQSIPASIGQQAVRKAARDLAANLSRHAFGIVNYAARDLQDQIKKMIDLLDHQDIKSAFGARDMWGVIDQVATLELGGARSSARYRTLATCGAIITRWLAQNVKKYNSATSRQVIDLLDVTSSDPSTAGEDATNKPTDYDLVNACELWLADTAVPEDQVEGIASRPRETPAMTSQPIQIPSFAKDVLDSLPGLSLGAGVARH